MHQRALKPNIVRAKEDNPVIHCKSRRIGSSSHTALRSGCESFWHVFDYFLAWSGIFEIFDVVFSCGIWCYGTEKGKMNFFPLSSFLLSNFGGNEKVCNTRNPALSLMNLFETVGALFFIKKAYPKNPLTLV